MSPFRIGAFRDDDDAEARAPSIALQQALGHQGDVERDLGNENRVGAAGDAGVKRDPAGVAPHHFGHHDPAVRLRRRVQPVDGIGGEGDRGIEAETVGRADDVVVDGLRDADQRDAAFVELVSDRERAIAADDDERVERHPVEHLDHAIGVVPGAFGRADRMGERVAAVGRAEDGAAEPQDAGHIPRRQRPRTPGLDEAVEAVFDADAPRCRRCRRS